MTVRELILMLEKAVHFGPLKMETPVTMIFDAPVTGIIFDETECLLTDEEE